jgi:energy-coupling factor transporter ATP-binding protein EcfA2
MAPLLSLTRVTKRYVDRRRETLVLDDVSLHIDEGDFVGMWGPKRSGKSTLLRVMAGIVQPDSGDVRFAGRQVQTMSTRERARLLRCGGIGLVNPEWRPQIIRPAVELVAFACTSDGTPMPEAKARARGALERVGATECADVWADQLSLGERLRVVLALALVREPRLLLVDEPAVLPSPLEADELYRLLRSLGEDRHLAVVVASENLAASAGALRTMAVSSGEVRSTDEQGVLLRFPAPSGPRSSRADDARP